MATAPKRSFTSFVKRAPVSAVGNESLPGQPEANFETASENASASEHYREARSAVSFPAPTTAGHPPESRAGEGNSAPDRTRIVTSTGRVRTYTASRNLPGITLRLPEDRWERLKLLSIQEHRPMQEILGEALDAYMRTCGRGDCNGRKFRMRAS